MLITAIGCPGSSGTIMSLKDHYDLIGCDSNPDVWKYNIPFYRVPVIGDMPSISGKMSLENRKYVEAIKSIKFDAIIPHHEYDNMIFAYDDVIKVKSPINSARNIRSLSNKFTFLSEIADMGKITFPFFKAVNYSELKIASEKLGFPFVIKPVNSSGGRGFRIVVSGSQYETGYKNEVFSSLNGLKNIGDELVAMPLFKGTEWTVDCLARDGEAIYIIPRKRTIVKQGVSWGGIIQRNDRIETIVRELIKAHGLSFFFGFQFIEDDNGIPQPTECNARIQGTMAASTLAGANIIKNGVDMLFDRDFKINIVDWNRRFYRFSVLTK